MTHNDFLHLCLNEFCSIVYKRIEFQKIDPEDHPKIVRGAFTLDGIQEFQRNVDFESKTARISFKAWSIQDTFFDKDIIYYSDFKIHIYNEQTEERTYDSNLFYELYRLMYSTQKFEDIEVITRNINNYKKGKNEPKI